MRRHEFIRAYMILIGLGICCVPLAVTLGAVKSSLFDPFPRFNHDLEIPSARVGALLAVLWALCEGALYRVAYRVTNGGTRFIAVSFLVTILTFGAWVGWSMAMPIANAWLDMGPRISVPVVVHDFSTTSSTTIRFGTMESRHAVVSRVDHPDERVGIDWNSCPIEFSPNTSPFATLRMGKGAFGAPWISLPVLCRPLAVTDRALGPGFALGGGRPAVLVAINLNVQADPRRDGLLASLKNVGSVDALSARVLAEEAVSSASILNEDDQKELEVILTPLLKGGTLGQSGGVVGRRALAFVTTALAKQDPIEAFAVWRQVADATAPAVPLVILWGGDRAEQLISLRCPRCKTISKRDVDPDIYRVFSGSNDINLQDNQLYLADASGRRVFSADLLETAQSSAFQAQLKSTTASR